MSIVTIHMIGQAHLDPVWLWGWPAGLDEVLATCRTACDLLDAYPEFIFTRGEAWSYRQVERVDPALFDRIRAHVHAGRWEIAGGWWLQPDCNFPSGIGFARQIEMGKRYLLDRFGIFPEVGYNVDSFGHAATLPGFMQTAGQRYYVMMRPQEHEMTLPARVFRWRGYDNGPEVTTFRIAGCYCTGPDALDEQHIRRSLRDLPDGITDTMCFYGVGDHGGGATANLIEWITTHRDAFDGCRLAFSSPSRFFAMIAGKAAMLPLVTGELQYHAIGCYSVQRAVKTGVRQAEQRLRQAEVLMEALPEPTPATGDTLEHAWQHVCFAQFHDILGGTCVPSAYPPVYAMLGSAVTTAEETLQYGLRQLMHALPDDPLQRIVLYNASDAEYDDYVEVEPWTQWRQWQPDWRLVDADGQPIAIQPVTSEAQHAAIARLLFRVHLAPRAMGVWRIHQREGAPALAPLPIGEGRLTNNLGVSIDLLSRPGLYFPQCDVLPLPHLTLVQDQSDNWSHSIDRYPEGPCESALWHAPVVVTHGPLMSALLQEGQIGHSRLQAEWRLYRDMPFVELRLQVHWLERRKVLKLVYAHQAAVADRLDGIMGGSLRRANTGRECPVQDWTLYEDGGIRSGIVCPDVFAADATPWRTRFTLLRSPIMTHHEPNLGMDPRAVYADQGVHHFRFRFYRGAEVSPETLIQASLLLQRPLLVADLTRGMPRRC